MNKWEITAGREVDWSASHDWWVMTWITSGSKKRSDFSPTRIWIMDTGLLMLGYPPSHAVQLGDKTVTVGSREDKHIFYLLPENVWARMPMEVPKPPNVEMFFEQMPSGLTNE